MANLDRGKEIRNRFVGEKDPASLTESSRLYLNETENAFYQDYLVQLRAPRNPRGLPRSNRLLWDCFRFFERQLDALEELREDGRAVASLISETASRQLLFILITVDDELNAYTIFETLNARALELSTTDLLRNHLFSRISVRADLDALQRRWRSLVATVGQERFPEFLRCHLLCKLPKVRGRRLFKLVRDQTRTAQDAFKLIDDLEGRAELFAALSDLHHGYWMELPEAKEYVRDLHLFRVRQAMPLLFTAWESFSAEDFVRVLKLVSVISFRYMVVGGLNPNALESACHRAAKAVMDGDARTPAAAFDHLKPVYVDDERTRRNFALLVVDTRGQKKLAKYILARLEQDVAARDCDPDTDPGSIEHILPENPVDAWGETFPADRWESSVYRLGNLTLLECAANRGVGNGVYAGKLDAYRDSGYVLTRQLAEMAPERWTPALMDERQRRLAERAAHVWRSDFA